MTHKLLPSLFCIVFIFGCTFSDKDFQIKGVTGSPTWVAPIATGDVSILDLLKKQDSARVKIIDGQVYLVYDTALFSFNDIRKLVDIPDIGNIDTSLPIPPKTYPANQPDDTVTLNSQPVDMGISPEQLKVISFKWGTLSYKINVSLNPSTSKLKYAVIISIPEFISNTTGKSFAQEVRGSQTGSFDLKDYTFNSSVANTFNLKLSVVVKTNSQSATVNAGSNMNVSVSFTGMDFNYITGFFGDQIAPVPPKILSGTVSIPPFTTNFQSGATVSFAQPKLSLDVYNQYGVPLTVTFSSLTAQKQGATSIGMVTNPSSPIPVNSPTVLGDSVKTSVDISNVKQLIDFGPTSVYYKVSGHINPGLSSGSDFMGDKSEISVRMHTEIPLYGKASNIVLRDTMNLDLSDFDKTKIDSASLKASIVNELPLEANIQFIMYDSKNVFIDSVLTPSQVNLVKGSTVDSNGDLVTPGKLENIIPLQKDKVDKIFRAKKIIVVAKMNTSKNASGVAVDVRFREQYKIHVKLGLRATVQLNASFQ